MLSVQHKSDARSYKYSNFSWQNLVISVLSWLIMLLKTLDVKAVKITGFYLQIRILFSPLNDFYPCIL